MKISVIVPTYKPQDYIWECLESLATQTLSKDVFEVIIVLNGCGEPWKSDIERYIALNMFDMNIKFIQTDYPGVSNARNIALDTAAGDFIAFIDDDDYVSPTYLSSLLEKAGGTDTIVLSNAIAFNDGFAKDPFPFKLSDVYRKYSGRERITLMSKVRKYFSGPCMKLIPVNIIKDRRFDVRFKNGEDSLFMFLISDRIKSIKFSDSSAVYNRRYRQGSAVTSYRSMKDIYKNSVRMMRCYSEIFWSAPLRYNFNFYLTRILADIKVVLIAYVKKIKTLHD